ncbi:MAG: class I SAM-dependent methyltransferase [Proteobacteria bacterium]|nr:class I SAM-dependent methyltransferase [Pseudomonadota bacterium]
MDKLQSQATMFANRLKKRAQFLKKWADRQHITAYRVYDRDIPEIPLCVDLYGLIGNDGATVDRYACMALFERPYEKDPAEEELWLETMCEKAAQTLDIPKDHIFLKTRKRQKGSEQYVRTRTRDAVSGVVREGELEFGVNLSEYLDTGLFMDHRPLRQHLTKIAEGKRVLNLFGYTGALSCAAAKGGAAFVQTVDLSNTYLDWAAQNLELNGFSDDKRYPRTRFDVVEFLQIEARKRAHNNAPGFDIILLDPPTFSNSKKTEAVLDTNKQWPALVKDCLALLADGGTLYFSTNSRKLSFDRELLPATIGGRNFSVVDVTDRSIPEDFKAHRIHRCWKFTIQS